MYQDVSSWVAEKASKRAKKPFKVAVSAVTLVAFLFNIATFDTAWAAKTTSDPAPAISVDEFKLPYYLGHIRDTFTGSSGKLVIHIQDAHCNYAAQNSIYSIIDYLNKNYGIDLINLEGGEGVYDLSPFNVIPEINGRKRIADRFLKDGFISAAEFYSVVNPDRVALWGIEDTGLYLENLDVYRKSLVYKEETENTIKKLHSVFAKLKVKTFSKELLAFDMKATDFKERRAGIKEYVEYLAAVSKNRNIELSDLKNIGMLTKTFSLESGIDFKKANIERDQLIDELNKTLSKREMKELAEMAVAFKMGRIPQVEFYDHLSKKAAEVGVDVSSRKALSLYIGYIRFYSTIKNEALFNEISSLEGRIKTSMYCNDDQRELDRLFGNLYIIRNIFNITLTRDEFKSYTSHRDDFSPSAFKSLIKRLSSKYGFDFTIDQELENLGVHLAEIERFYLLSFKRDEAFLKNMRFERPFLPSARKKINCTIVITGGFHTENFTKLLKENGISYISIMPNFGLDNTESPYFKLLGSDMPPFLKFLTIGMSDMAVYTFFSTHSNEIYRNIAPEVLRAWIAIEAALADQKEYRIRLNEKEAVVFTLKEDEGAEDITGVTIDGKQAYVRLEGGGVMSRREWARKITAFLAGLAATQAAPAVAQAENMLASINAFLYRKAGEAVGPNIKPLEINSIIKEIAEKNKDAIKDKKKPRLGLLELLYILSETAVRTKQTRTLEIDENMLKALDLSTYSGLDHLFDWNYVQKVEFLPDGTFVAHLDETKIRAEARKKDAKIKLAAAVEEKGGRKTMVTRCNFNANKYWVELKLKGRFFIKDDFIYAAFLDEKEAKSSTSPVQTTMVKGHGQVDIEYITNTADNETRYVVCIIGRVPVIGTPIRLPWTNPITPIMRRAEMAEAPVSMASEAPSMEEVNIGGILVSGALSTAGLPRIATQPLRPNMANMLTKDIGGIRKRITEAKLSAEETEELLSILRSFELLLASGQVDVREFNAFVVAQNALKKKWQTGFNTIPGAQPKTPEDILLKKLSDLIGDQFTKPTLGLSTEMLDSFGSDADARQEYLFYLIVRPILGAERTTQLQPKLFKDNYTRRKAGGTLGVATVKAVKKAANNLLLSRVLLSPIPSRLRKTEAWRASNEVDLWQVDPKTDLGAPEVDVFLGFGSNNVWDYAMRRNTKTVVIAEMSPEVIIAHEYLYKPLLFISDNPAQFLSRLAGIRVEDIENGKITDAQQAFAAIEETRKTATAEDRERFAKEIGQRIVRKMESAGIPRETALFYGNHVFEYLENVKEQWERDNGRIDWADHTDLYQFFRVRYHINEEILRARGVPEGKIQGFMENWKNKRFSVFSSPESFKWLKDIYTTDNVKYVLTDINHPEEAYKAIGERLPGRNVGGLFISNIIDVELSGGDEYAVAFSGVIMRADGSPANPQSAYLATLYKHVSPVMRNLPVKDGLTVYASRIALRDEQTKVNTSNDTNDIEAQQRMFFVHDRFQVPSLNEFWDALREEQPGKIAYSRNDIDDAKAQSTETPSMTAVRGGMVWDDAAEAQAASALEIIKNGGKIPWHDKRSPLQVIVLAIENNAVDEEVLLKLAEDDEFRTAVSALPIKDTIDSVGRALMQAQLNAVPDESEISSDETRIMKLPGGVKKGDIVITYKDRSRQEIVQTLEVLSTNEPGDTALHMSPGDKIRVRIIIGTESQEAFTSLSELNNLIETNNLVVVKRTASSPPSMTAVMQTPDKRIATVENGMADLRWANEPIGVMISVNMKLGPDGKPSPEDAKNFKLIEQEARNTFKGAQIEFVNVASGKPGDIIASYEKAHSSLRSKLPSGAPIFSFVPKGLRTPDYETKLRQCYNMTDGMADGSMPDIRIRVMISKYLAYALAPVASDAERVERERYAGRMISQILADAATAPETEELKKLEKDPKRIFEKDFVVIIAPVDYKKFDEYMNAQKLVSAAA